MLDASTRSSCTIFARKYQQVGVHDLGVLFSSSLAERGAVSDAFASSSRCATR
jgi:hypothetical protein